MIIIIINTIHIYNKLTRDAIPSDSITEGYINLRLE